MGTHITWEIKGIVVKVLCHCGSSVINHWRFGIGRIDVTAGQVSASWWMEPAWNALRVLGAGPDVTSGRWGESGDAFQSICFFCLRKKQMLWNASPDSPQRPDVTAFYFFLYVYPFGCLSIRFPHGLTSTLSLVHLALPSQCGDHWLIWLWKGTSDCILLDFHDWIWKLSSAELLPWY